MGLGAPAGTQCGGTDRSLKELVATQACDHRWPDFFFFFFLTKDLYLHAVRILSSSFGSPFVFWNLLHTNQRMHSTVPERFGVLSFKGAP